MHAWVHGKRSISKETFETVDDVPRFVITECNVFRQAWHLVLLVILTYTGTLFPYRFCFRECYINGSISDSHSWAIASGVVDVLFYIDFFVWFFFTYRDGETGEEVRDISRIVKNYLQTYFIFNLVACIPSDFIVLFMNSNDNAARSDVHSVARFARLQRISRMMGKAAGVARFLAVFRVMQTHCCLHVLSSWTVRMKNWWFMRIINLIGALFWTVHLLACGWYMIAYFHEDPTQTWLARRDILSAPPLDQWLQSCYFILTVFTSVGFGDIYALSVGEVAYALFAMAVGCMVQAVITSEVVNIATCADQHTRELNDQKHLLSGFIQHGEVHAELSRKLMSSLMTSRSRRFGLKRDRVRAMLTSNDISHDLKDELAKALFRGELIDNKFTLLASIGWMTGPGPKRGLSKIGWMAGPKRGLANMPPSFPLMLSLLLNERTYLHQEMVYHAGDFPWTLYLVIAGTFAYVGYPSPKGGIVSLSTSSSHNGSKSDPPEDSNCPLHPFQLLGRRTYFGDLELLTNDAIGRFCGARCESIHASTEAAGQLLELPKHDLTRLIADFHIFGKALHARGKRRNEQRQCALWRLRERSSNEKHQLFDFASSIIQRQWRAQKYGLGLSSPDRDFLNVIRSMSTRSSTGSKSLSVNVLPTDDLQRSTGSPVQDEMCNLQLHHKVHSMQKSIVSVEQKVDSMQQKVDAIEKQMCLLTSLLSQHLGGDSPIANPLRASTRADI